MANGCAVATLVPALANPSANDQEGIKLTLGTAMANAVEALGAGLADYDEGGRLTDANRTRGGDTVAAVVELQLAALGEMPDFSAVALTEGKRILHDRHGATLRQQLGSDAGIDEVFSELLSHVLAVATEVAAVERVFRAH